MPPYLRLEFPVNFKDEKEAYQKTETKLKLLKHKSIVSGWCTSQKSEA